MDIEFFLMKELDLYFFDNDEKVSLIVYADIIPCDDDKEIWSRKFNQD
jgi:hypothetical protein